MLFQNLLRDSCFLVEELGRLNPWYKNLKYCRIQSFTLNLLFLAVLKMINNKAVLLLVVILSQVFLVVTARATEKKYQETKLCFLI